MTSERGPEQTLLCILVVESTQSMVQLALGISRFCILRFNQPQIKNIGKKIPGSSKTQNLNLPHAGTIYLAFAWYLQLFTWHLHCIRYYQ